MKNDNQTQQARGQILIGIQRLAGKYPFHAKTLERFDLRPRPAVGTMGVTLAGDDILLLYNPAFVLTTPLRQLIGVLLHEVHHCVFGHLLAKPADYPDHWARTVAEEVSVNEFVTEPLPEGGITLDQFPALPPLESTGQRYRRLRRERQRFPLSLPTVVTVGSTGGSGSQAAGNSGQSSQGGKTGQPKDRTGVVVDDHSVWLEAAQDPQRAEAALKAVLQDAAIDVGAAMVPDYLRDALGVIGVGHAPGCGQYDLSGNERGTLDWVQLLRRYVSQELAVQPDFLRPSRRFPELVGIVPGRRRRGSRPRILAAIDTSGSITPELLELISAELARLAGEHSITVVECDTKIHKVYPYKPIRTVHGRGGTDLRPPLAAEFLRTHHADMVIYFTDGFGPAPDKPPHVPVLWCLAPDGEQPAKWGRAIRMSCADTAVHKGTS